MSVRFDATGDQYTAATGLPGTTMTALWWGRVVTDRNTYSTFVSIDAGDTQVLAVQTASDGVSPYLWLAPHGTEVLDTTPDIGAMTVGNWYRMAVVRSTTAITLYLAPSSGTVSTGSATLTGGLTPTILRVGQSPTSGEWLNGSVANLKIYNAALTQTEIEAEWGNWSAVRSANLLRHHKWQSAAETTDYSGNGWSLTSAGTPTFDSGNPSLGANAVTGTVDASLGGLTATLVGSISTSVTGTILASLGGLSASVAGLHEVAGTVTATLGGLSATLAGSVAPPSILADLGGLTATITGVRGGFGAITVDLGGLTAHLLATGPVYPAETLYPSEDLWPGDEPLGVEFLVDTLSRYARVAVEVAFGAELGADPDTWDWTDVTDDVRVSGGGQISITHGRGDEASKAQPAKLGCTLDNRAGRYSLGAASAHYPYVRRNVPVRVSVNLGENLDDGAFPGGYPGAYPTVGLTDPLAGTFRILWQGFADGFTPKWDITGRDATVQLSASGVLRRLSQGASPLPSPARRSIPRQSKVVAYWPCEDGPESTVIASGLEGGTPMTVTGPAPNWQKNDKAAFSEPVLQVHDATLTGQVPAYDDTGAFQVRAYVYLEDEGTWPDDFSKLITVHTTGSVSRYEIRVGLASDTGRILVNGYTSGSVLAAFSSQYFSYILDRPTVIGFQARQETSTTIRWEISRFAPGDRVYYLVDGTTAGTLGRVTRVVVNPDPRGNINLCAVGHIAVRAIYEEGRFGRVYGVNAAELATDRLRRLCEENGVPLTVVGTSDTRMGPQQPGQLLDLLRECETADQGILVDGLGPGLTYICRSERAATVPALTADVPSGQLARELTPVDDDQRTRNRWEITRTKGAKGAVEDVTGLLGSAAIGLYDSSLTVNTHSDTMVRDYAGWLVNLGTIPGYRWPRVSLDLAHSPELAARWVAVRPSSWLRMTGVNTVRTQLTDPIVDLLAEGYTQQLDRFRWNIDVNTSPRTPWAPAVWAADLGDASEAVLRCDGDGSTLAAIVDPEDTAMIVTTPAGPLWTTAGDDYPLVLDVGGHQVTATACTAADGRQQTFTIAAPGFTLRARTVVQLWQPRVPAL